MSTLCLLQNLMIGLLFGAAPLTEVSEVTDIISDQKEIQRSSFDSLINEVEAIIESDPSQAFDMLITITLPEGLDSSRLSNYYQTLGWNFNLLGNMDTARQLVEYARELAVLDDSLSQFGLLKNLADIEMHAAQYASALDYYQQAMTYLDTTEQVGHYVLALNTVGHINRRLQKYEESRVILGRAYALSQLHPVSSALKLSVLNELTNLYYFLGEYEKVREMDIQLVDMCRQSGNKRQLTFSLNNLGEDYQIAKDYSRAINCYTESLAIAKSLKSSNLLISPFLGLAEAHSRVGDINSSDQYLDSCFSLVQKGSLDDRRKFYQISINVYSGRKDYLRAYESYKNYISVRDSIFDRQTVDKISELETKYQTDQKEAQNKHLTAQATLQEKIITLQRIWIAVVVIFLVIVIVLLYFQFRTLRLVQQQKQQISEQSFRLKALDQYKSRFFANISHDLRSPLLLMRGYLQKIRDSDSYLNESASQSLHKLEDVNDKLTNLTDEIRDLILLEENRLVLSYQKVHLNEYLLRIVALFHSAAHVKKVQLDFIDHTDSNEIVHLDPQQFEKVIYNLLTNALKFTSAGDVVTMSLAKSNHNQLQIAVSDTGEGIALEKIKYVFDRFYQASDEVRAMGEGLGIGLSLVVELVELHEASIKVESELGLGTTFPIDLPRNLDKPITEAPADQQTLRVRKSLAELSEGNISLDISENTKRRKNQQTILVVDDHPEIRTYIKELIDDEYIVRLASNGKEALDVLTHYKVDLILTDLMMPVMNGHELIDAVRFNDCLNAIPLLVVSARTTGDDLIKVLEHGVNDFVAKPFDAAELKLRIRNALTNRAVPEGKVWDEISKNNNYLSEVERDVVSRVNQLILDRVDDSSFTVQDISDELKASQRTTYRLIKDLTGQSPKEYIRLVKFQFAADLMKKNRVRSVSEAAQAIGLLNTTHFSVQFEKVMGIHPNQLLKKVPQV